MTQTLLQKSDTGNIEGEISYLKGGDSIAHVKFMYMYMMENGIEISQECRHNLKTLEEEMEATFR